MTDNNQPFYCERLVIDMLKIRCPLQCDYCKARAEAKEQPQSLTNEQKHQKSVKEFNETYGNWLKEEQPQSQETGEVREIKRAIQMIYVASKGLSVNQSGYVAEEVYSQFIQPLQQELKKLRDEDWKFEFERRQELTEQISSLKAEIERLKPVTEPAKPEEGKVYHGTYGHGEYYHGEITAEAEISALLHEIEHDPYPEDIFPPVSSDDLKKIHELLQEHLNMPIDRLSAHIGRLLRKPLREKARAIYEKFKGKGTT